MRSPYRRVVVPDGDVPAHVVAAVALVKEWGWRNMGDRASVLAVAEAFGYADAAGWVAEHRSWYAEALRQVLDAFQAHEVIH